MKLEDYTTEELKNELKRRAAEAKEKRKTELKCRNCIHIIKDERYGNMYHCAVRTWGKKIVRNYCIKPCFKACDKFEKVNDNAK